MTTRTMTLQPGEPAAGPWRVVPATALAEQLVAAGAPADRPRIIAIDGRGGAGKTRLAERLAACVPRSGIVHTDDLAWHHSSFGWTAMMAEHVLLPLHRGEAVEFRPPAWVERGRPGSITVPGGLDAVWVEGTGIIRRPVAHLLDASVWLQVDRHEAESRLLARDGDSPAQLQLIEDWGREERPVLLAERPWAHATVVVAAGSDVVPAPPDHVAIAPPVR